MISVMPQRGRMGLTTLAAVGGVLAMALLNWHVLTMEIDISPNALGDAAPPALPAAADGLPDGRQAAAPTAYPETLARPLFRPNRRPAEAPQPSIAASQDAAPPDHPAKLPEDLQLVGIMKQNGGAERALIRSEASPTGHWVEIGHLLAGWRLSRIESGGVLFERDGAKQSLSLLPAQGQ